MKKKILIYAISLFAAFMSGYVSAHLKNSLAIDEAPRTQEEVVDRKGEEKPAYLVAMVNILNIKKLGPYRAVAEPLAKKAGYQVIASGQSNGSARLLEGNWPGEGLVFVERYDSMDKLINFWNSEEFEEAKKLREDIVDVNFVIAIEAGEHIDSVSR